MPRGIDAKRHSLLRLIGFSPLGERLEFVSELKRTYKFKRGGKFFSEFYKLRNFREGFNLKRSSRNSNSDRRLYFLKNINYNSDMLHHDKNNKGRLGILAQHEAGFEPSPAFVMLTKVRKRLLPLTKREGSDFVIISNFFDTNHSQLTTHNSLIPDIVFSRFTSHFSLKRKAAFTLAEVLITLGIIGIVSALTMPAVINHFKAKKLEVQFKTADAMLTKAIKMTVNELGYEDLKDLHLNYYVSSLDNNGGEPRRNLEALNDVWVKQFKGAKQIKASPEIYHRGVKTYGIIGNNVWPSDPTGTFNNGYLLPNGMYVGRFWYNMNSSLPTCLYFIFDTNGPYRGPNRYGHDIFKYVSIQYRWGCNPVRGISSRSDGCYWYAHNNINPAKIQYDYTADANGNVGSRVWFTTPANASKPDNYWDILFKNESYWRGE